VSTREKQVIGWKGLGKRIGGESDLKGKKRGAKKTEEVSHSLGRASSERRGVPPFCLKTGGKRKRGGSVNGK